jgi:hypothetical protein
MRFISDLLEKDLRRHGTAEVNPRHHDGVAARDVFAPNQAARTG